MKKLKSIWTSLQPESQDIISLMAIIFFMLLAWFVIFAGPIA